jgi:hypothetical protein
VVPGEPLAAHLYLAQVDPGPQDSDDGGVLDAGGRFDVALASPLTSHGEDPPHDGRHLVGDQLAVDQVVAGLGPIDPLALAHGLVHAHANVLGQLLPIELGERSEDVVEHPPGRRREVDLLGEEVQSHPALSELVGQHDEVTQIPGQPVEPPRQHAHGWEPQAAYLRLMGQRCAAART